MFFFVVCGNRRMILMVKFQCTDDPFDIIFMNGFIRNLINFF